MTVDVFISSAIVRSDGRFSDDELGIEPFSEDLVLPLSSETGGTIVEASINEDTTLGGQMN